VFQTPTTGTSSSPATAPALVDVATNDMPVVFVAPSSALDLKPTAMERSVAPAGGEASSAATG